MPSHWIHKRFVGFVRRVQRIMGLHVTWEGQFPDQPAVLMGNHRSYVDAVLFPVGFPVVYVGRIESKSWPVIGWGATLLGTIWVNRKSKDNGCQRQKQKQKNADKGSNGAHGWRVVPKVRMGQGSVGAEQLEPRRSGHAFTLDSQALCGICATGATHHGTACDLGRTIPRPTRGPDGQPSVLRGCRVVSSGLPRRVCRTNRIQIVARHWMGSHVARHDLGQPKEQGQWLPETKTETEECGQGLEWGAWMESCAEGKDGTRVSRG